MATVTFEIFVNINVTPFAEVFLAGTQEVDLGETPLNHISVPVGGTLVFIHPTLGRKTYRVNATDNVIYLKFP